MSDVQNWIILITLICGLLGSIATLIPVLIKLFKTLKEIVSNKNWKQILQIANRAIKVAEATGLPGANKQQMVIDAIVKECQEFDIEVTDKMITDIIDYIKDTVKWFNDMNEAQKLAK